MKHVDAQPAETWPAKPVLRSCQSQSIESHCYVIVSNINPGLAFALKAIVLYPPINAP